MRALIILAVALCCSCGRPPERPKADEAQPEEPPARRVRTTGTVVTVNSKDGSSSFVVRSKVSDLKVGSEGPDYGTMRGVRGEILRAGKAVSTYESDEGFVDRDKKVLSLQGKVTVTDKVRGLVLKAREVKYLQSAGRIEARGSVTVTSDVMTMGPIPELWASPDLKRIATPGKFK